MTRSGRRSRVRSAISEYGGRPGAGSQRFPVVHRDDRQAECALFILTAVAAGLAHLALALLLSPPFADLGMAFAVVLTEVFVVVAMFGILRLRRLDPFSIA